MTVTEPDPVVAHRGLIGSSRRRTLIWVIVSMIIGGVVGLGYGLSKDAMAQATTTVLVTPLDGNAFSPDGSGNDLVNLNTEARLVTSDDVGAAVADAEGDPTQMRTILDGISVEVPPNTQIIRITASGSGERIAVARSQKFAEEYLEFRRSRAIAAANDRADRLDEQLDEANERLKTLVTESTQATSSVRRALLREQTQSVSAYIVVLQTQLTEARSTSTFPGQIVTPASQTSGISTTPFVFAAAGAVAGLLLGLLGAAVTARADGRIRHPMDLESAGVSVITTTTPEELGVVRDNIDLGPSAELPDAFRLVRAAVLHERPRPIRLMVGPLGDGGSLPLAGVGLAMALARAGIRTAIIDLTEGPDSLAHQLGHTDAKGLTEALQHRLDPGAVLIALGANLHLIPMGQPDPAFDDLLVSKQMTTLVSKLTSRHDALIVLTPTLTDSRSHELLTSFPLLLIQVDAETVEYDAVAAVADWPVLGAVFVSASPGRLRGRWPKRESHSERV